MGRHFREGPRNVNPSDAAAAPARLTSVLRDAGSDLWRALPDLVIYDLLFKAVALVTLSPLLAWVFERFVAASGNAAVGNLDLARFLLTPFGLVMLLVVLSLAVAIFLGNLAGLAYIGLGAAAGRRITYFDALLAVGHRFLRILLASCVSLLIVALALLPLVIAALVTARLLLGAHDINFYLDARPPEFQRALLIGGGLGVAAAVVLLVVSVPLGFVLPYVLVSGEPLRRIFPRSFGLARGDFRRVLLAVAAWAVVWSAASFAMNGAILWAGRWLVGAAGDSLATLLVVLGSVTAVSMLANFALSFVGVASGCLVLVRLFLDAARRKRMTVEPIGTADLELGAKPTWSVPRKAPLAVTLVALVIAALVARGVLAGARWQDHVDNTAHRGASLAAPENTLAAVQQAIDDGATFVEVDVQRTSDGVLVVAHDADLMRVARNPAVISQTPYDQLRNVDVGSFLDPQFADQRIPTLDEVIDLTQGKVKLIVELKSYDSDAERLVADVVDKLRQRDVLDQAVVMSLEYSETQAAKQLEPQLVVGFVASAALGDIAQLDVDFLAVSRGQATDTLIAAAHAQGKQVFVWTIDDRDGMFTLIDRGVDNIITNDPALLRQVLAERESLDNAQRILLRFKSVYVD